MDAFGGGSNFKLLGNAHIPQNGFEQCTQMGIAYTRNQFVQFPEHVVQIPLGAREVVSEIDFAILQPSQFVDRKLSPLLIELHQPFGLDEIVAVKGVHHFFDVVPHLRFNLAGTISELKRQVGFTGFLLPDFFV